MKLSTLNYIHTMTEDQYMDIVNNMDFESLNEGAMSDVKDYIRDIYSSMKSRIQDYIEDMAWDSLEVALMLQKVFRQPTMFNILKLFGFSIAKLTKAFFGLTDVMRDGLHGAFVEINKLSLLKKVQSGAMTMDELIAKYPVFKRVTGITLSAFMLFVWINMTFIGNPKYDFDWSGMKAAFAGKSSLAEVLTGPKGTMMMGLFALGVTTGLGFGWFGVAGNIAFALFFTGYEQLKDKNEVFLNKMRQGMNKIKKKAP